MVISPEIKILFQEMSTFFFSKTFQDACTKKKIKLFVCSNVYSFPFYYIHKFQYSYHFVRVVLHLKQRLDITN